MFKSISLKLLSKGLIDLVEAILDNKNNMSFGSLLVERRPVHKVTLLLTVLILHTNYMPGHFKLYFRTTYNSCANLIVSVNKIRPLSLCKIINGYQNVRQMHCEMHSISPTPFPTRPARALYHIHN